MKSYLEKSERKNIEIKNVKKRMKKSEKNSDEITT